MAQNPFYVYALKDPRQKPAKPFYIGKGTGNRAWEHQAKIDESEKGLLIKEILEASHSVIHTIIADNLTEQQALMELAKANPNGISNSDAAKYLGLQSDYGGGSKDYLSYSLIGLLMKESRLVRTARGCAEFCVTGVGVTAAAAGLRS